MSWIKWGRDTDIGAIQEGKVSGWNNKSPLECLLYSVTGIKTVKVCFSFERTAHESLPLYGEHTLRRSDVNDIRFLFTKK